MKVLIVGSGGREHALAWKCAQSLKVSEVLVAPGNGGTATEPRVRNVNVAAEDIPGLVSLAQAEKVGLTIIGPEGPLVAGVVDAFHAAGLRCFGPTRAMRTPRNSSSDTIFPPRPTPRFARRPSTRTGCARSACPLS